MADNDNRSTTSELDQFVRALYPDVMKGDDDTIKAITDLANMLGAVMAVVLIQRPAIYQDVKRRVADLVENMAVNVVTIAKDPATDPAKPADYFLAMDADVFIRVYELPINLTQGYCHGPGVAIPFTNVDWFNCRRTETRADLVKFIKGKRYYHKDRNYLVIGNAERMTFTFNDSSIGLDSYEYKGL